MCCFQNTDISQGSVTSDTWDL